MSILQRFGINRNDTASSDKRYILHVWDKNANCFGVLRESGKVLLLDYVEAQVYEDKLVLDHGYEIRDVRIVELDDINIEQVLYANGELSRH
jgi:hypothetical protein